MDKPCLRFNSLSLKETARAWCPAFAVVGLLVGGCAERSAIADSSATQRGRNDKRYTVKVHQPDGLGAIETRLPNSRGDGKMSVPCVTCHGPDEKTSLATQQRKAGQESPHAEIQLKHGSNNCGSCHDTRDRSGLHLADGAHLPFSEVMTLCGQCHGPQFRDYSNGSHGGKSGYWDQSRGPAERNHCVDCHDPHQPSYPQVMPKPRPLDRKPIPHNDTKGAGHE